MLLSLFTGYIISILSILLVAAGLAGYTAATFFVTFVPAVKAYDKAVQLLSVLLLGTGLFLRGTIYSDDKWAVKVHTAEAHIAELEAKGQTITEVIKVVTEEKIKYVKVRESSILDAIHQNQSSLDTTGVLPPMVIKLYNEAIK